MEKIPKYTGPKTVRMIQDVDGKLIKIQIPKGLVESGVKGKDVTVEHYVRIPLEPEDYTHLKTLADNLNLTVDQLTEIGIRKLLKELEEKTD